MITLLLPPFFSDIATQEMTDPPPYTFRQNDLPKLNIPIDRGTDFDAWRAQREAYRSLSELANVDATKQVQVLTLCLSRETLSVVHNLGLSEAQMRDAAEIRILKLCGDTLMGT